MIMDGGDGFQPRPAVSEKKQFAAESRSHEHIANVSRFSMKAMRIEEFTTPDFPVDLPKLKDGRWQK